MLTRRRHPHRRRSSVRYWIASATCPTAISEVPAPAPRTGGGAGTLVRNRPRQLQDPVIRPGGEAQLLDGAAQQLLYRALYPAVLAALPCLHRSVRIQLAAPFAEPRLLERPAVITLPFISVPEIASWTSSLSPRCGERSS
jgi:hypothetical protein